MVAPIDLLPVKISKATPVVKTKDGDCVLSMENGFTWKKVGTKEEVKKDRETIYLESFLKTETGQDWFKKNEFINYEESEEPDFVFKRESADSTGLEITTIFIEGGIAQQINRTLQNIVNRVFKYFIDKEGIKLGIDIEFINKESFTRLRLKREYMGLLELPMPEKDLEQKIIEEVSKSVALNMPQDKRCIDFDTHFMKITVSNLGEPVLEPTASHCERMYREDPFEKVQKEIDKKNKKISKYNKNCSDCVLLVVADASDTRIAPSCFTNKLKRRIFKSDFKEVYLLETGGFDIRVTRLRTKPVEVKNDQ